MRRGWVGSTFPTGHVQGGPAVGRRMDIVALAGQVVLEGLQQRRFILDNENPITHLATTICGEISIPGTNPARSISQELT